MIARVIGFGHGARSATPTARESGFFGTSRNAVMTALKEPPLLERCAFRWKSGPRVAAGVGRGSGRRGGRQAAVHFHELDDLRRRARGDVVDLAVEHEHELA